MEPCRIVTVIQARCGSTRLPDKVMLPLAGKPLLIRQVERVQAAKTTATVVVATTTASQDDSIEALCNIQGIPCFRGHETDLLDRHYQAGKHFGADAVVKIPSDCPLIDPQIIDWTLALFLDNPEGYDFVSNLHPPSWPDGNDVEIMSMKALEIAHSEATADIEREHTTPFFWRNPHRFRNGNVVWQTGLDYSSSHRWTIDYMEDYLLISAVYDALYPLNPLFGLQEILDFLQAKPDIRCLNSKYLGKSWYDTWVKQIASKDDTLVPEKNGTIQLTVT